MNQLFLVIFTESLFRGLSERVPLACFRRAHPGILPMIADYLDAVVDATGGRERRCHSRHLRFLPLLLAVLERVVVVGFPFDEDEDGSCRR